MIQICKIFCLIPYFIVNSHFNQLIVFQYSYQQAQSGVLEGIQRLHTLGVATKRPSDFISPMVKSDAHMSKVRILYFTPIINQRCFL